MDIGCQLPLTLNGVLVITHYALNQSTICVCLLPEPSWVKLSFKYAKASDWNLLQTEMKLKHLVSCSHFIFLLSNHQSNLMVCKCIPPCCKLSCHTVSWPGHSCKV